MPTFEGTNKADVLNSTGVADSWGSTIRGLGGDDTLISGDKFDNLYGGEGNDLLLAGNGDDLYGGVGDDTLESGDSSSVYGGKNNDTYIVKWESHIDPEDTHFNTFIYEDYGTSDGGVDTIDLSHIVSSKNQVKINTESEVIQDSIFSDRDNIIEIYDTSNNEIGSIVIKGDIEHYKIGNQIFNLPASDSDNKKVSNSLGASNAPNNITARPDSEQTRLYGYDGDDTLKAGVLDDGHTQTIYGGDGDDLIISNIANHQGRYYGGEGNDTYKIVSAHSLKLTIYEYDWAADSDNDILDLSQVAENLSQIRFDSAFHGTDVDILNASGKKIGRINLRGDLENPKLINIEKIITRAGVFEIPKGSDHNSLEELRTEILANTVRSDATKDKAERLEALKEGDTISGGGGNDTIIGNDGDDRLTGGEGSDYIEGKDGEDHIWAGKDDNGDDIISGGGEGDVLAGGPGNDSIEGDSGLLGFFDAGADTMYGGAGDDLLIGGIWLNRPKAGEFNRKEAPTVNPISGDDNVIWGGPGDDSIYGTEGDELLGGGDGSDSITAYGGRDKIFGGPDDGADTINGGDDDDTIFGGAGNDFILGGDNEDIIYNGAGNDTVKGDTGDDTLWGGPGDDQLTGGEGADLFAFASGNGADRIRDFKKGEDKLDISDFNISDLKSVATTDTVSGISGVLLTLDKTTSIFLDGITLSDIDNSFMA